MPQKEVHIVCGAAGAGKTTYGKKLAEKLGAAFLDIDTVTERMAKTTLKAAGLDEQDRDSPAFKERLREPIYETLFDIACDNLQHTPVVITGPFTRECQDAQWPEKLETRLGVKPQIHFIVAQPDSIRKRIEARGNPRDQGKLEDWDNYARYALDSTPPPFEHHYIDTAL